MIVRGVVAAVASSCAAAVVAVGIVAGVWGSPARAAADWSWPVEGPRSVLRAFIGPSEPWRPGHRGIDVRGDGVVLAPAAGVVRFAGWVVDRGVLSIDHGDGVTSSFEPVTALVREGEAIAPGQPVATIDPGHCAVSCVHVGVRVAGAYRNPLLWLGGARWPVLLPTRPV